MRKRTKYTTQEMKLTHIISISPKHVKISLHSQKHIKNTL